MWGLGAGMGVGMVCVQDPPLQLHELCKHHLPLGLHFAMQSHKLNTCYKPGRGRGGEGEGRGRGGEREDEPIRMTVCCPDACTHSANTEYM